MSTNKKFERLPELLNRSLRPLFVTDVKPVAKEFSRIAGLRCFRLTLRQTNHPIVKAAAEEGLINLTPVGPAASARCVWVSLSGVSPSVPTEESSEPAAEVLAKVYHTLTITVSAHLGVSIEEASELLNEWLDLGLGGDYPATLGQLREFVAHLVEEWSEEPSPSEGETSAPSEDTHKFLIDDQDFSVSEEYKDVELPSNVPPKEGLHKLLDSAAERYVKESFEPYPTGMLLTKGDGLYPDTGHPTPLIKKLYGMGLIDLLGPKGNGDILMCLDTDKVDVKVKTSALSWELDFYQRLADQVRDHDPKWPIVHEWAKDSTKRGILFGERFAESTDQTSETLEMTNHDETVEVDVNALDPNPEPLPSWASRRSTDLQLGSQLCTRDGRRCGNAVVAAVWINSHGTRIYDVITDVGNVIHAEACEVREMFHPPEYVMKDEWVAEVTERVKSDG